MTRTAPTAASAIAARLAAAELVAVCAHVDPDGDAVGSTLGIVHALDVAGVACVPVLASGDHPPVTYAFLPGSDRYRSVASLPSAPDVVLAIDAANPERLGEAQALLDSASSVIVVDHHPDGGTFSDLALVDPCAPATAVLLLDVLPHLGVPLDRDIAECFFVALMTDTGRFSYANATAEAYRTAATLIEAGVDVNRTYVRVYEQRTPQVLELQSRALARLTIANGGAVAYSYITQDDLRETGVLPEQTENLIDEIRVVGGVDVVILFKVLDGYVKGSLRAKTSVDVGSVARQLGGGGHAAAAGFTIEGDLATAIAASLSLLPVRG